MSEKDLQVKKFPILLKKELDQYIVGQNAYKETMVMNIYRQIYKNSVCPTLVIGPTGSGKTLMFQCLKKAKCIPDKYTIMSVNISRLTEEGVKGPDLDDIFLQFAEMCRAEKNMKYRGIIHIDEIDKLIAPSYASYGESEVNRNATVQHQLMQILDGNTIAGIPTNNILFVFSGAFSQLEQAKNNKKAQHSIGFVKEKEESVKRFCDESIREKLLKNGFQREFLGRIGQIVELEGLTERELKAILLHPTQGVIKKIEKEYESDGIRLEIEKEVVDGIISLVLQENLGARSAKNVMEEILKGAWYHCIENDFNSIVVGREALKEGKLVFAKNDTQKEKKW